jgi:glycosyltransferase involved in cell wall biosynthesis
MKIIVSHDSKQHVNAVLQGLNRRGVLTHFFTSLAANKINLPAFLGKKVQAKLRKKQFENIDSQQISHFPVVAIWSALVKTEYQRVFGSYRLFDAWVARQLRKWDFDMVIGYENSNFKTFTAAKKLGKTTVLDLAGVHHAFQKPILMNLGVYENSDKVDRIIAQKQAAYAVTDYVLTLSDFAKQTLVAGGFPAEKIYKTYLGVNHKLFTAKKRYHTEGGSFEFRVSSFESNDTQNSALKTQNGKNTEGVVLLKNQRLGNFGSFPNVQPNLKLETGNQKPFDIYFVGTMSHLKGIPFLLDVHKTLLDNGLNVRLTLIGGIDDITPPQKETPQYRYLPFVPHAELVALHHQLDLFVFPSNMDSWGLAVVEAMACGTPVLVSTHTGAQDAVQKGGGSVLPVGDKTAWVQAIETYYFNPKKLETHGKQAAIVARDYTWEAYYEQLFAALSSIHQRNQTSATRQLPAPIS